MGSDGVNLDLTAQFPITFPHSFDMVLLAGDVRGAGGEAATQNVRGLTLSSITRETNFIHIGGWWFVVGH